MEETTKTTNTRLKTLTAGAAFAALAATGANVQAFDLSGTEVTIGTAQAQVLNIVTLWMIEMPEDWGADVTPVELPSIADRIDVASRSSDEILLGQSGDVDVVAFGAPISTMHYTVVSNTIVDFEGKAIGTSGFNGMLFRYMLKQNGLEPEVDVAIVSVGGDIERAAAIMAGQVHAAVLYIDNWFAPEAQGANARLLGYVADIVPGLSSRAMFAPREYLESNSDLITAMACANLEVDNWIMSSKEDFVAYTMDNVRGANEEAVSRFYDVALSINMFPTDLAQLLDTAGDQGLADLPYDGGKLDEQPEVDRGLIRHRGGNGKVGALRRPVFPKAARLAMA